MTILAPHADAIKEVRGWRFADALTDSEIKVVLNIAEKHRTPTPTPDLGVAVEALQWSKKRIEYLQSLCGGKHDCEIRYIDEALKSLGENV